MNKSEKQYKDEIIDKNSIFDELLAQDDKTHLFCSKNIKTKVLLLKRAN